MGHKILLADDSITIQKVIELTFSDEDFELHTVGNGQKAIDEVRGLTPDVVLCDIIMPEKNGYEVCEFIKSQDDLRHIPVLLLTGAFEPFDQERAKAAGCDGFLAKPFEPQTLISKVKELLATAPSQAAAAPAAARTGSRSAGPGRAAARGSRPRDVRRRAASGAARRADGGARQPVEPLGLHERSELRHAGAGCDDHGDGRPDDASGARCRGIGGLARGRLRHRGGRERALHGRLGSLDAPRRLERLAPAAGRSRTCARRE